MGEGSAGYGKAIVVRARYAGGARNRILHGVGGHADGLDIVSRPSCRQRLSLRPSVSEGAGSGAAKTAGSAAPVVSAAVDP